MQTLRQREPTMVYVDGLNLYHGLRAGGWRKYYWLDLRALPGLILHAHQRLVGVKYFTSRATANRGAIDRQNSYLAALESLQDTTVYYGKHLTRSARCPRCKTTFAVFEEKMTDVNIASEMVADAFLERFTTAILVSADSDLSAPLRIIRRHFPEKKVVLVFPPNRHSKELRALAHGVVHIGRRELSRSQFKDRVRLPDGGFAERPATWR